MMRALCSTQGSGEFNCQRLKCDPFLARRTLAGLMSKEKFKEPTLQELLAEPIIQEVMTRDGVRREHIVTLFENLRYLRKARAA